ncbi:ROK family transcriptional regulator [Microlunatus soli]|uniref:ROK family transcriptional regulator n=1 Tax=Microlunatus soli TaxID=630515 RepID=UPI00155F5B7C|nr:ROK family protein [Microlunatus soli]
MYASQQRVRSHNLGSVAAVVRERGGCSRTDIGEALSLNKATVSSLVGELIGRGLVEDAGQRATSGPGRPRTIVRPDATRHVSLVVEILTDRVRLSSWTLAATRLEHRTLDLDPIDGGPEQTLQQTAEALAAWVRRLRAADRIVTGIAVSAPGLVDTRSGTLVRSSPLQWNDVDIRAALQRRRALREVPVLVERVANLATVAEWQRAPELEDVICLHGGETGLGVGVVTGGRLLSGANGRAGGLLFADNVRMSVRPGRPASSARLVAPAAEHLGFEDLLDLVRDPDSSFVEEAAALRAGLDRGDTEITGAVDAFADRLGDRLVALLELFDPSDVIFAGPLEAIADRVIPRVRRGLPDPSTMPEVRLVPGRSGPEASLAGAALMLADRTFAQLATAAA